MPGDNRTRGGQRGDERIGDGPSRREAKTSERGELKRPQSVVLKTLVDAIIENRAARRRSRIAAAR